MAKVGMDTDSPHNVRNCMLHIHSHILRYISYYINSKLDMMQTLRSTRLGSPSCTTAVQAEYVTWKNLERIPLKRLARVYPSPISRSGRLHPAMVGFPVA